MTAPLFITTEKRSGSLPLLIVDKPGILSKGLISLLSEHFSVVLVSEKHHLPHLKRVSHVAFKRSIPSIPDEHYAGILLFYNGESAIKDGITSFIKKAKQNNAKLIIITSREHASDVFLKRFLAAYDEAHLLITGDIFGIGSHEIALPTHMVHEAARTGKVSVVGSGLSECFPVYYADTLQGILHVLLSHSGPKVGLLYPKSPVAHIHLARLITKLFPNATIMFIGREGRETKQPVVPEGEVLIEEPYPLAQKLQHITSFTKNETVPLRIPKTRGSGKLNGFFVAGLTILLLMIILPLMTFGFFLAGLLSLKVSLGAGKSGDLTIVKQRAESAHVLFTLADNSAWALRAVAGPLGLSDYSTYYQKQLATGKTASDLALHIAEAGLAYQPFSQNAPESGVSASEQMLAVSAHLKQAILNLGTLKADNSFPEQYKTDLLKLEQPILRFSSIVESLPFLTGVGKEKVYLVLFQNNMELRPGGGFIGSYGLLTMKDGKIASFTVHDVYDADGQLTTHVDVPFGLARYLGSSHLFLRDSNFAVEFEKNAAMAASLLQLSTNDRVDGVVTVDVSFLRSVLRAIGPVYLPDYNETVTADSIYLATQKHAEVGFFPGSTQKKDYLEHVAKAIILALQEKKQLPYLALLESVDTAIAEKHIQVASADPTFMTIFLKNGLASSVRPTAAETRANLSDFLGIFEANVGANKANYYLKRSLAQKIELQSDGTRQEEVRIQYKNSSTPTSPFGGEYKNYLRLVLPAGSQLTQVLVDGVEQILTPAVTSSRVFSADGFVPPTEFEVNEEDDYGRRIYGMFLTVPLTGERVLTVRYSVPSVQNLPENFSYLLRIFKQPGTDFDPYQLSVTYAPELTLLTSPGFAGRAENTLRVQRELSEDLVIPLTFTHKE